MKYFFSSVYKNVVTEENEETVSELNNLVGLINNFVNNDNLEYQCNLITYFNSAHELIFSKQLR